MQSGVSCMRMFRLCTGMLSSGNSEFLLVIRFLLSFPQLLAILVAILHGVTQCTSDFFTFY